MAGICIMSFAIPRVNGYIGMQQVSQLADKIADEQHIKAIYVRPFRSSEFLSLYVEHKIEAIDNPVDVQSPDKQLIIIDNHDLKTHPELIQDIYPSKVHSVGKYSLIEF